MLSLLARYALAIALANDPGPRVAESACADAWEPDSDAWHECVCTLATWQCGIQDWCSDPQGRGYWTLPPLPQHAIGVDAGCQ
jgi:hypothetical protein